MFKKIKTWYRGTFLYYWKIVISSVLDFSDIKDDMVSTGRGLLVGFFATLFSYIYQHENINVENASFYIFIFFSFALVFYIGERLIYIPAKLFREKEEKARMSSWADIEIKPFTFDKGKEKRISGYGVGLQIISDKPLKNGEFVDLPDNTYINRIEQGAVVLFPSENHSSPLILPLLGGSNSVYGHQEIIKQRNDDSMPRIKETVIPIANWDEDSAWITAIDKRQEALVSDCGVKIKKDIVCRVVIHAKGRINALEELMGCEIFCDLLYYKKDGQMTMSIDLVERHPKYEL